MSDEAAAFDALVEEFFSVWFRYHPDLAAAQGVSGFERLLPAQGDDELAALGAWLESLVVALEELDYPALDPGRQLDLCLMFGAARVEHQELLERDWRRRDPLRFLAVGRIDRLLLDPPPDIGDRLVALLAGVPDYLRLALTRLRTLAELAPPALVDAAVEETERGRCALRELVASPWLRRSGEDLGRIESAAHAACDALATFGGALRAEIAGRAAGRLGCGGRHLRFLLRHRHFMDLEPRRAQADLEAALGRCQDQLAAHCASLGVAPDRIFERLGADAIDSSRRLDRYRAESERLAALVASHQLLSLPAAELRIREPPPCPRPLGLGADDYVADPHAGRGTFFLAPLASGGAGLEPLACVRARCLDRTWTGDHLLAFAAGNRGWRLPRRLSDAASLTGAWRLYVRERLEELGCLEPNDRLLALTHRCAAIQRGLLDLELHLGELTETEAKARLASIRGGGTADLIRLARRPGNALAGVLGWRALNAARERALRAEGFSEAAFHDRLFSAGRVPLSLILAREAESLG